MNNHEPNCCDNCKDSFEGIVFFPTDKRWLCEDCFESLELGRILAEEDRCYQDHDHSMDA